ncbi:site-2 protease family protein [Candidatus Sumerlaeota bacterium]|nr:site-2 protease family protein [Candidatus Sumerlaeota bacterium]
MPLAAETAFASQHERGHQRRVDFSQDRISHFLITYPIFLLGLTIHEFAHAITAKWGGDMTAAYKGRVTLNPIAHIDPIGTVVMPVLMAFTNASFLIGWAKPVPVVEANYRRGKSYGVIVALAGPFSNLLQAFFFAICIQVMFLAYPNLAGASYDNMVGPAGMVLRFLFYGVFLNIILMVFNLMPLPPLDGSYVLWYGYVQNQPRLWPLFGFLYQYGFFILMLLSWLGVTSWWLATFADPIMTVMYHVMQLPYILGS